MIAASDLIQRIGAEPFRPFRVRLTDGTSIAVPIPRMFVGPDKALVVTKWRRSKKGVPVALDWRTIPLSLIEKITESPNGRKRQSAKA